MKKLGLYLLILLPGCTPSDKHVLAWLEGKWKLQDKEVYEVWTGQTDGNLDGRSFRVNGADTVILEQMRITYSEGSYHYIPFVAENKVPIDFKITTYSDTHFVAENPAHDFPKVIRYTIVRKPDGEMLEAVIEGNGKVIPYAFHKMK